MIIFVYMVILILKQVSNEGMDSCCDFSEPTPPR